MPKGKIPKRDMPEVLEAIGKAKSLPQANEVVAEIVKQFGGSSRFAVEFVDLYSRTSTQPATKLRMLDWLMRMMQLSAGSGLSASSVDGMTNEELKAAWNELEEPDAKEKAARKPPRPKPGHTPSSTTGRTPARLDTTDQANPTTTD